MHITRAGRWSCVAGAALGALALVGWLADLPRLTTFGPGQPPMMPNTCVGLVLVGTALALRNHRPAPRVQRAVSLVAAAAALAIAALTLAQYVFAVDLGIDQLVIPAEAGPYPGRPSPPTAFALMLLATAALAYDARPTARVRPAEVLALAAGLTGFFGMVGHLFGAEELYRLARGSVIGMALPTSFALLLLTVGALFQRPDAGLMRLATSPGPAGVLIRRLIVPVVIAPALLGLVTLSVLRGLGLDETVVVASFVAGVSMLGLVMLPLTTAPLERTHEALSLARARARDLIEQASDGIFVADLEGRYTEVNAAGCKLLGHPSDAIVGKTIVDFLHPDEHERLQESRTRMLRGETDIGDWHLRHANGTYITVEVSAKVLPDGRWQGLVRDITLREALERELREARSLLESVFESTTEYAVIALDHERKIVLWNEGARRTYGYSAGAARGASVDMLHVEDDVESGVAASLYARALSEGSAVAVLHARRRHGSRFLAHLAVARRMCGDLPAGFVVLARDVTREQRRVEHEQLLAELGGRMTESLDRSRIVDSTAKLLVRDLADACLVDLVDVPGQETSMRRWRAVHRDPRKEALMHECEQLALDLQTCGLSRATLRTGRAALVPYVTPEFLDEIADTAEHRRVLDELAPRSLIAVPLRARGILIGAISLVSCGEHRRFDEDDLPIAEQVAQRLASALDHAGLFEVATKAVAARDEVLSVVAHDLRSPLAAAALGVSMFVRSGDERRIVTRDLAARIQRSLGRASRLIDDLLDITRLEGGGGLAIEAKPVPPAALAVAVADMLDETAAKASIALEADVDTELPDVLVDEPRIVQALGNLVGNALKFTPAAGIVRVTGAVCEGQVELTVSDTGPGIPADQLAHLFDRFWQANRRDRRGAGLGLAITKGIVEAHGGRIWVESEVGRGTTFHVLLPIAPPAAPRRAAPVVH